MKQDERYARDLQRRLQGALEGVRVTVEGKGVRWAVEAIAGDRRCRVSCFDYDRPAGALMLGPRGNAHLSRVNVGQGRPHQEGPEYMAAFHYALERRVAGRTQEVERVVAAVRDWLVSRLPRAELCERHTFVDENQRARSYIATTVNARFAAAGAAVRVEHEEEAKEFGELWIYAGERSARLEPGPGDTVSLALLGRRTQLALLEELELETAAKLLLLWCERNASLEALRQAQPSLSLAPFASEFERGDFASWHWGNVLLQAENDVVLGYFRPLLERVARHQALRRYFSYTSMNRLYFSFCSLFPFETEGLPTLARARGPSGGQAIAVLLGSRPVAEGDVDEVFPALEEALQRQTRQTWFGGANEALVVPRLNLEFERRGTPLRAEARQSRQWLGVEVRTDRGQCRVSSNHEGKVHVRLSAPGRLGKFEGSLEEAVDWLEVWLLNDPGRA